MIDDRVSIARLGAVADIRLRRPAKMNALDGPMFDALIAAAESVAADPTIRAVVLSGEGKAFCAGIDLESLQGLMSDEGKRAMQSRSHGFANRYQQAALAWREVPVPVIAALHGVAFGGGLQIPLGADIRISAPDTKFSLMEVRWGIVPDMAGTILLRSIVREDVLRELIYTARVFTGTEAALIGIVTQLASDPHAAALELAQSIAKQGPRAVRAAKQLLNETQAVSPQAALLLESEVQIQLLAGPDQIEALSAHAEQRVPCYTDQVDRLPECRATDAKLRHQISFRPQKHTGVSGERQTPQRLGDALRKRSVLWARHRPLWRHHYHDCKSLDRDKR